MSISLEEARRIMSEPTHPQHKLYQQGDPILMAKVDEAFERSFGSHEVEIDKINMGGNNHG